MKNSISLEKEISSILSDAKLVKNGCIAERINESGYKCVYRFKESNRDILLRRAAQIQRKPSHKFQNWQNGINTQKIVLFLKENKETLQTLYDISYLMKAYGYDAQKASKILFKQKLPAYFHKNFITQGSDKISNYYVRIDRYSLETKIEYLIDYILPVLPIAYLKDIDGFNE